jgi:hypothetical protein
MARLADAEPVAGGEQVREVGRLVVDVRDGGRRR